MELQRPKTFVQFLESETRSKKPRRLTRRVHDSKDSCYSQPHFKILLRVWQKPRTTFKQNQLSDVERVKTRDSLKVIGPGMGSGHVLKLLSAANSFASEGALQGGLNL